MKRAVKLKSIEKLIFSVIIAMSEEMELDPISERIRLFPQK